MCIRDRFRLAHKFLTAVKFELECFFPRVDKNFSIYIYIRVRYTLARIRLAKCVIIPTANATSNSDRTHEISTSKEGGEYYFELGQLK